jgi:hypothetical protein
VAQKDARADKVAQRPDALARGRPAELMVTGQRSEQRLQQQVHVPFEDLPTMSIPHALTAFLCQSHILSL